MQRPNVAGKKSPVSEWEAWGIRPIAGERSGKLFGKKALASRCHVTQLSLGKFSR
jgi:hypothetical protein